MRRRAFIGIVVAAFVALQARAASAQLPERLSDSAFWKLIVDYSEPNGYFQSDNLLSNEMTMQWVIPRVQKSVTPGNVYLGVGPEQNLTYIANIRPKMAFIVDIRRGNLIAHMMYKALFELSPTRADFVARLFGRNRPSGLDTNSTADQIFTAVTAVAADTMNYFRTYAAIEDVFKKHNFGITQNDLHGPGGLEYVLSAYYYAGPWIDYNYPNARGGANRPNYWNLMVADDGAGLQRSYLATEANYRALKDMHARNLIVPLVGDFAGPKALRGVGTYLKERGGVVGTIYTSNVEQYLFQSGDAWSRYYTNVGTLPIDSTSTFIRSYFGGGSMSGSSLLQPVSELLRAFREGRIFGYNDVIGMSR